MGTGSDSGSVLGLVALTIVVVLAASSGAGEAGGGDTTSGPVAGASVPGSDGASSDEVPAGSGSDADSGPDGDSGGSTVVPPVARRSPRIADGDHVEGVLNGTNTEDWYRFDAEAGQVVRFVGAIAGGGGAGRITVFGPSGEELANATNRADLLDESPYGALVEESGTHYVRFSVDESAVGDVRYPMDLSIAAPDPAGENDARSDALELATGETVRDNRAEGDDDWFAVTADAGDRITATLALADSEDWLAFNDVGIEVYDDDGRRVGELDGARTTRTNVVASDRSARQVVTVDETGTYYVRVTDVSVEGYTAYDLAVDVDESDVTTTPTPTPTPGSTPTATPGTAGTATPSAADAGTGAAASATDSAWPSLAALLAALAVAARRRGG